ncbi:Rv3235 family protein [Actinoplanes sp. NPDC049668]|uniref:Rv3235 family protein n=1 Tax=unclassified Actinoplanes TaxID=2626549 RepID=UPI0033BA1FF4
MSTIEVTRQGPRPAIRLRPAPRREPPFDDERDPASLPSPDQLALDWARLIAGDTRPATAAESPPPVIRTVVSGVSADAKLAVRRFVKLCVEVFNGYRPPAHLRRFAQAREAATVVAEGLSGAQRVAGVRLASSSGGARPRRPAPVAVLRLRLCEPRAGAVEAAVVLMIADRVWAMALRLELHEASWVATALRLI